MLYMIHHHLTSFQQYIIMIASTINTQSHFLIGVYYQHFSNIRVFMHLLVIFYDVTCIPLFMCHTLICKCSSEQRFNSIIEHIPTLNQSASVYSLVISTTFYHTQQYQDSISLFNSRFILDQF